MRTKLTVGTIVLLLSLASIMFLVSRSTEKPGKFARVPAKPACAAAPQPPPAQPAVPAAPMPVPAPPPQVISYWRNAHVGDWVRFLTHQQKVALFEVKERKGSRLKVLARHFNLDGDEIPARESDIRSVDIEKDEQVMRAVLQQNPFVSRSEAEWKLYKSDRTLKGDMHEVENPRGEDSVSLSCREVRSGGYTYERRGRIPYVILIDFGSADNPPAWDEIEEGELCRYWHEKCSWPEPPIPQEDPAGGEPPELPEK